MDNNIERIRDALAGAILGALAAVVIFLVSIIISVIHFAGGNLFGEANFSAMQGSTFTALIIILMLAGAALGFYYGYRTTQEDFMRDRITKWMFKHNS